MLNLLVPTSIITVVAIFGFFTPATTGDDRTEKFNLGITTLLAMSILLLMVSDQMPTTSEFVPLIGKNLLRGEISNQRRAQEEKVVRFL